MVCQGDVMDIDLPTEHGPTEETVEALMDYLVGPLLPLKLSDMAKDTPSESQQKSVAKQVHAAAVLYNYYHRNHHQESEFLKFDQFCCLAIMFKPSILHHMKYMSKSDRPVLDDPEKQLSLAEKAIMDACTISETLLDATTNVLRMIKGWPISKVAVLLIDSKKENCFLQFNDGVWSVIEKDLYSVKEKGKKRLWKYDEDGEVEFQKLAFMAVKEATGIGYGKLKILESHVVYSLSQAKTSTHFYIVQSTQSISEDNLVPIQDAICSLQGPVVKKSSGSWVITPVVEYYYLLPYAEIISKLFSRVSNSVPRQVEKGSADSSTIQGSQKSFEKGSGESKKLSDNLIIKSNLDAGSVHSSNLSKEEAHDRNVALNCVNPNNYSEPISVPRQVEKGSADSSTIQGSQKSFEKGSGESKKLSDNLIIKSNLDAGSVHSSNLSKEEAHDRNVALNCVNPNNYSEPISVPRQVEKGSAESSTIQGSQKSFEKGSGESKKLSDNLTIKSNLDAGSVHSSNLGKEEAHDRNVALNCVNPNNYSEPISEVLDDIVTSKLIGKPFSQKVKETESSVGNKIMGANGDSMKQKDMNGSCKAESNSSSSGANSKGIDKPLKVYHHEKRTISTKAISIKENLKDTKKMSTISQKKDEKVDGEKNSCMVLCNEDKILTVDHALEDFHVTVDAKSSELSEAALRALLHKRRKLCDQQHNIERELTLCNKKIQAIMRAADGDCLGLKLEAVIDCCNEICQQDNMQAQEHTNLHGDRSLALSGKSLSEAQLTLRKACQELDDICLSNSWMLPSYRTTCSNGMYVTNVTVKGLNFECVSVGGLQPSMHEARNSAATHLITKLQQMAGELNTALP